VTAARPHDVEHGAIRVVVLDHARVARVEERSIVGNEKCLAVGHHQVGLERGAGQASADHRDRADRVGDDLAVTPEAVGDRGNTHVGETNTHRALTFAW